MAYGEPSVYPVVVASGASTSSAIRLYASWDRLNVQVGTMSTATQIGVQHSVDGSNWFYLFHPTIQSTTVGTPQFLVATSVGAGGGCFQMPYGGFSYIRFVLTSVVSGGVSFNVIASQT